MSIYDGYKLANSTEIPRFQGSAGDEFIKVGQYKQGLYDQASQTGMNTGMAANELNTMLPQDAWAVDELRKETQGKIGEIAKKGDWENALPEVNMLSKHYTNREQELLAPQRAAAEYRTKTLTDKEKNLTPEQQSALYAMSVKGYSGVQKNARGQYMGVFTGVTPAKNIDVNKKVDEWLKDAVVQKYGTEADTLSTEDGGMWIIKNGEKVEHLGPEKLRGIIQNARANDQEYQAYQNMQGRIAGFNSAGTIRDANDITDPKIKAQVQQLSQKYGMSESVVYSKLVEDMTKRNIDTNAESYGLNKYAVNNKHTEFGIKDNPYMLKQAKSENSALSPIISQGPDSKVTADEANYDKLTKSVTDLQTGTNTTQATIDRLTKDLASKTLSPATRTQKQADLASAQAELAGKQGQINRAQDILNYSKDKTARDMGYDDYETFLKKNIPAIMPAVTKVFPNGFRTSTGRLVSAEDIAEAAADKRLSADFLQAGSGTGGGAAPISRGAKLTLKDGSTITIPTSQKGNALVDAVNGQLQKSTSRISEFNDKLTKNHTSNVSDFSIQSSNISMNEADRKEVAAHIKSNMDGVKFSNPGQNNTVSAPKDFEVYTIGTVGLGNDAKIRVQELDSDKKPTGKFYDVTMTNSNISEIMSRKAAESQAPESKLAADILSPGSGTRQLYNLIPGNKIKVGQLQVSASKDADPVDVSVKVIRDRNNNISYNLINESTGEVLKSSGDAGTAGSWIDNIQGKDTYSNGRRKDIYDVKSRRPR